MAASLPKKQKNALEFWLNSKNLTTELRPLYEAKLKACFCKMNQ